MIFIPKKIRILPLSVAMITAISFSTSVFATTNTATYLTTTTYTGTSTVTVSSTISGADANEQITYLVHKPLTTPVQQGQIVYIDQVPASATGSASFKFTTADTNLGATTSIKFGAAVSTGITPVTGTGSDVLTLANPRIMSLSNTVLKSVLDPDPVTQKCNPLNSIITFGTITGGQATDVCGILFSTDPSATTGIAKEFTSAELTALTPQSGTVRKFPALGRNGSNGTNASQQFAIQLVDGGSDILKPGTYYTRAYGVYNGTVTLGDVKTVILPASGTYTLLN